VGPNFKDNAVTASGHLPTLVAVALAALLTPCPAAAEALDGPACNQLKNEQERLAAEGLKTDMLRGPEWAKSNLPQAKLDQIRHLMDVEEQLLFRCPVAAKPAPPQTATSDPTAGEAATPAAGAAAAPAGQKPVQKKARTGKKKPSEAAASDTFFDGLSLPDLSGDAPAAPPAAAPAAKPPQKKKAKPRKEPVNDAFVPPPSGNALADGEPVPQPPPPKAGAAPLTP
jgi:hypothetical protein